jgi:hypothetical protein
MKGKCWIRSFQIIFDVKKMQFLPFFLQFPYVFISNHAIVYFARGARKSLIFAIFV